MSDDLWPPLTVDEWTDTYATLHMWTQVVGKITLATAPKLNHCWGSALRLTEQGLATGLLAYGARSFTIAFDFVDHQLRIAAADGNARILPLAPRSVADFYRAVIDAMAGLGMPVKIWTMPSEIPDPVRFEKDTQHHSYDPVMANRYWKLLLQVERVLTASRCAFVGKVSPAHFFWGGFDLALTRFSGRPAPTREGPASMRDAYSHEVISHGFWPGSGPVREAAFYAYAVPEPAGLNEARVEPAAAYYHRELGEFILPYEDVRRASSPETALRQFIDSTYAAAATLGNWDRALDR